MTTNKEHEWLEATYNTDANDYDNRNNNQTVKFRMTITDDTFIDDIIDAAYKAIPGGTDLDEYPNLEILQIVDEDGARIVGEDEKTAIKILKETCTEFRVFPCAKYTLTPQAILMAVFDDNNVSVSWEKTQKIFEEFMRMMEKHGYVKKREESED